METDEAVVKNVKQFVNEFENVKGEKSVQNKSGIEKKSPQKNDQKCFLSEFRRVSAIKESLKKHMQREYIPNRDIPHGGRSLAEVKCDLSKSMELSQEVKITFPSENKSLERNVKKTVQLTRYNSTDVLSQGKDETSKRFYPVPAPRQCNLVKNNRRYKSNSDLTSTREHSGLCFNLSNMQYGATRSNTDEHLAKTREVSFPSKLSISESLVNKSSELFKEDNGHVNDESTVNTEKLNSKDTTNFVGDSKSVSLHKIPGYDGVLYCFRLCCSDWDNIISSLSSDVEETFAANIFSEEFQKLIGESSKTSFHLCCNFNSIVDVLTFKSVGYSVPHSAISRKHVKIVSEKYPFLQMVFLFVSIYFYFIATCLAE